MTQRDTNHSTGHRMMTTHAPDGYMSYRQAAEYLDLSRRTLERAVKDGRVPYVRDPLTGRVRFRVADLNTWMAGRAR